MQKQELISKDTLIGEAVEKYPAVAFTMTSYGLHCVGCGVNEFETIEQGAIGHGMPKEMLEKMMQEINSVAKDTEKQKKAGKQTAHLPEAHPDEKIYPTKIACQKVTEFMKQEGKEGQGLRISAHPGGCAGFQYVLEFDKPTEKDLTFKEHDVTFIVAKNQMEMLAGLKLDYTDGLHGSGFKIENPNATGSCGCGKSFH